MQEDLKTKNLKILEEIKKTNILSTNSITRFINAKEELLVDINNPENVHWLNQLIIAAKKLK